MTSRLLILSAVFGFAGTAHAVVLIEQNFDNTTTFVAGTTFTAAGVGNAGTTAGLWRSGLQPLGGTVRSNLSFSPGQSISTERVNFGEGQVLGYVNGGALTGDVEISFKFNRPDFAAGGSFRTGYNEDLVVFDNIEAIGIDIQADNRAYVSDAGAAVQILDTVPLNEWQAFKFLIDLDAKTYDTYYSADATEASMQLVYAGAVFEQLAEAEGGTLNSVMFVPIPASTPLHWDDVLVSAESVAPEPDADFDGNTRVDGVDFLAWQKGFGLTADALPAQGDADGNGAVNGVDYDFWKAQFGDASVMAVAASIPEPTGAVLAILASAAVASRRRGSNR